MKCSDLSTLPRERARGVLDTSILQISVGFLLKRTTSLPSSFPHAETTVHPSLRLHRMCDLGGKGATGFNTGPGGGLGAGGVVCDPTEHNCRNGNGPKKKGKTRVRQLVFRPSSHFCRALAVGWWGGGGGGRVNLLQKTHSDVCLCIYVCTYIYTKHCTKNPVVHHL